MHFSTVAAAALLSVAALMPADANAQSPGQPYRAVGTEPFWSLTIDGRTMRLESPDRPAVVIPAPKPIIGFAGEIYRTRRMNVNVTHTRCSDGMSDRTFRDTVTVTLDGRTLRGCGGETISGGPTPGPNPGPALRGEWRIRSIAGRPPVRGTAPSIRFDGNRLSGTTGCNSFSGRYDYVRRSLNAGPLISTKRGCIGQVNGQERAVLDLLGKPLEVSRLRGGRMVLTARGGRTLVLAPVR